MNDQVQTIIGLGIVIVLIGGWYIKNKAWKRNL